VWIHCVQISLKDVWSLSKVYSFSLLFHLMKSNNLKLSPPETSLQQGAEKHKIFQVFYLCCRIPGILSEEPTLKLTFFDWLFKNVLNNAATFDKEVPLDCHCYWWLLQEEKKDFERSCLWIKSSSSQSINAIIDWYCFCWLLCKVGEMNSLLFELSWAVADWCNHWFTELVDC